MEIGYILSAIALAAFGWFIYTRINDKPLNPFKGGSRKGGGNKDKY